MKNTRLIIGIITIVLVFVILLQSCAAGAVSFMNYMDGTETESEETPGLNGFFMAIFFLIAGIVGIATRKGRKKGGAITSVIFYTLAGVIGITGYGDFADLQIWSYLSFIFAFIFLIAVFVKPKSKKAPEAE